MAHHGLCATIALRGIANSFLGGSLQQGVQKEISAYATKLSMHPYRNEHHVSPSQGSLKFRTALIRRFL